MDELERSQSARGCRGSRGGDALVPVANGLSDYSRCGPAFRMTSSQPLSPSLNLLEAVTSFSQIIRSRSGREGLEWGLTQRMEVSGSALRTEMGDMSPLRRAGGWGQAEGGGQLFGCGGQALVLGETRESERTS